MRLRLSQGLHLDPEPRRALWAAAEGPSKQAALTHRPLCLLCRPSDENHPQVKPDAYVNNLAEAVDTILSQM